MNIITAIITSNATFYAHWKKEKTITYNSNGGEFDNSQTTNAIKAIIEYNHFKKKKTFNSFFKLG